MVSKTIAIAAVTVAALTIAVSLGAQQPVPVDTSATDPHAVQPERPTVATHAGTVAAGWLEIEAGVERDRIDPSTASYLTPTTVKIGLASHLQLGVSGAFLRPAPGFSGVGDITAGVKWRLLDDAPILGDFAVLPAIKVPTGSPGRLTGTGSTDESLLLISSHDLRGVSMDINAGYTHRHGNGSTVPTSATLWTFSFGGSALGNLGWTAELYGYPGTGGAAGAAPIVALLAGPTYLVRGWLAVDTGIIRRIAGGQPNAIYAGGVYNVGQLWGASR